MIELRKIDEADYPAYETLVTDERVMRYITEQPLTKAEAKRRFASIIEQQRHDRLGTYLIYQDATWIGIGHITRDKRQSFEAELGYMLLPEQWGHGYGSLLASRLLELATEHELTVVTATIDPSHKASKKILTNLGFRSTYVGPVDGLPGEILEKRLGESS